MKFKDFYSSKLNKKFLENLDVDYRKNFEILVNKINGSNWTNKQKKVQKKSILQNIALYKTFIEYGISKEESRELVREFAYYKAAKIHRFLKKMFRIPKFKNFFKYVMGKTMKGEEIWCKNVINNNNENYSLDITKCLWWETCKFFECPELCEVYCLSDHIIFENIDKLEFNRSETLGMNGEKCDFRFNFKK